MNGGYHVLTYRPASARNNHEPSCGAVGILSGHALRHSSRPMSHVGLDERFGQET